MLEGREREVGFGALGALRGILEEIIKKQTKDSGLTVDHELVERCFYLKKYLNYQEGEISPTIANRYSVL